MEGIVIAAAALACPVGMGAMMWFMAKGMRKEKPEAGQPADATDLRAEHARLGAELERLEPGGDGRGTSLAGPAA